MTEFPRTMVGGVSLSRMIIGSNWFLGYSHTTRAKDAYIKETVMDRKNIAAILEVFLRAGVDTLMAPLNPLLTEAAREAEDVVGRKIIFVATPGFPISPETAAKGWDVGEVERVLDEAVESGAVFCMPHQEITDRLMDKCTREIRQMNVLCRLIRQRGMVPGLSSHAPETIVYADETGLDVETYISIYNSMGFLMQVEVDWVANVIREAKKPVMTIKPMAAGQLRPFQGLSFVWNTIRDQDMVTVGTMSPREVRECVELSFSILERRTGQVELQETRSKGTLKRRSAA
jgi:hypothetical protein